MSTPTPPYARYNSESQRLVVGPGLEAASTLTGAATTVGASTATLLSIPVPAGKAVRVEAVGLANEAGAAAASGTLSARARNLGGVLTVTTVSNTSSADAGLEDALLDVAGAGATLVIAATGAAGHTLTWACAAQYLLA